MRNPLRISQVDFCVWADKLLLFKSRRKRFTREEYGELLRILGAQNRVILRRPQFIVGFVIVMVVVCYPLYSALYADPRDWMAVGWAMLYGVGAICSINAVREHFSEVLLRLKQHPEEIDSI